LAQAAYPRVIRWSPSVTLVPTHQCFNACGYCSFRLPPRVGGPLVATDWLSDQGAEVLLDRRRQAAEVLLLSGEVPPDSPQRPLWFGRLVRLSQLALQQGRLPHTNAGPLSRREMAVLARFNPSLGLMLEGLGPVYDRAHRQAPSKRLALRLAQLEQAGRLGLPFTTGLLLGLGESRQQRLEALELLALLQGQWGNLQEVILQPWRPDAEQARPLSAAERGPLLETIAMARAILPAEVHLQLPPNLWPLPHLAEALDAGIDDLGGIDTGDVINPAYPQASAAELAGVVAAAGYSLRPRLCVHDAWIPWLPARLRAAAERSRVLLQQGAALDC
jgi:7,8-didemethyl-8-hydroxy-5-deazariboflavin synthase